MGYRVAIMILSIAVFVLFWMYIYERSKANDQKQLASRARADANREVSKLQWEETKKFYYELDRLVDELRLVEKIRLGSKYYTVQHIELPSMPDRHEVYYDEFDSINGFRAPVRHDEATTSKAIELSTKIITARIEYIDELMKKINNLESEIKSNDKKLKHLNSAIKETTREKDRILKETISKKNEIIKQKDEEIEQRKVLLNLIEQKDDNLKVIPYMAKIMADYETYPLEEAARKLDWGYNVQREKKVASIRDIRKAAKEMVEKHMNSEYQLAYLLKLFPNLEDIIDAEFNTLPPIDIEQVAEYDRARDYLSKEEYSQLSTTEKNQLALDRYRQSHTKTKWQIGRDYELYIGYIYTKKGYDVEYFGEFMGLEDLGRDLICKKDDEILIIQCKYWAKEKTIHEKHITQLYGTTISYCIEHNLSPEKVKGVLVTNIEMSQMAHRMADYLDIDYKENIPLATYPCIKCNIGVDGDGQQTKIYHLPFDQQYDNTKIDKPGEFFAMTVKEAEEAGFRRAFKWFASSE